MFGLGKIDLSSVSEYFESRSKRASKKKDLYKSKVDQVLHGEHEHYFSKQEMHTNKNGARCKVCGLLLSEYIAEQQLKEKISALQSLNNSSDK